MQELFNTLPAWLGPLGWLALLLGLVLQQRAWAEAQNKTTVLGFRNVVSSQIHQPHPVDAADAADAAGAASRLSNGGNWGSIVGLGLSLLSLLTDGLARLG